MLSWPSEPLYGSVISFGYQNNPSICIIIENSLCWALYNRKTLSPDTAFQGHVHMHCWWHTVQPNGDTTWHHSLSTQCAILCSRAGVSLVPSGEMPFPALSSCWASWTFRKGLPFFPRGWWSWVVGKREQAWEAWSLWGKDLPQLVSTVGRGGVTLQSA